jgi:hypothetical protein
VVSACLRARRSFSAAAAASAFSRCASGRAALGLPEALAGRRVAFFSLAAAASSPLGGAAARVRFGPAISVFEGSGRTFSGRNSWAFESPAGTLAGWLAGLALIALAAGLAVVSAAAGLTVSGGACGTGARGLPRAGAASATSVRSLVRSTTVAANPVVERHPGFARCRNRRRASACLQPVQDQRSFLPFRRSHGSSAACWGPCGSTSPAPAR